MNWLMYIGGGILFVVFVCTPWHIEEDIDRSKKLEKEGKKKDFTWLFKIVVALMVWIWICWRFIK